MRKPNKVEDAWVAMKSLLIQFDDVPLEFPETEEKVMDFYRMAARTAHPDAGGTPEQFSKLGDAKNILIAWSKNVSKGERLCEVCNGSGKRQLRQGFNTMTMVCGHCGGSGEAK